MGFNCPHCSTEIAGAMTQEAHLERLKAKDTENKALREQLTQANTKVKDFDTVTKERDTYKSEITGLKTAGERRAAFDAAGIPEAARQGFELVYNSQVSGLEEDKRPSLSDWLNDAETKAHPFLAPHFAAPGNQPVANQQARTVAPPPKIDNGVVRSTETKAGPKTGAELAAYFASPEFQAMPREQQKQVTAELKGRAPRAA